MGSKIEVITNGIQEAFPNSKIHYLEKKFELHKFRIDREGQPSCWLYLTWEYIEDNNEDEVLAMLRKSKVFEIMINPHKQKWFAFGDFGLKEVDDSYGRGH